MIDVLPPGPPVWPTVQPVLDVINIGINPVLVHIGPLAVRWYGLMYVVGIIAGLQAGIAFVEERGITRDQVYEVFWPVLIAGLVGGRLYYVVQSNLGWYLRHPQNILATWEGGMAFYGAIFLGGIALIVVSQRRRIPTATLLDGAALLAALGQAIGRVGNIINGDILGYPSNVPWATRYINPDNTFVPSHTIAYQPAAAYELLFSLALFLVLWRWRFRFSVPGALFALWVILYSAGQFVLFFGRANTVIWAGLKQAQLTALIVILLTIPLWFLWRRWYEARRAADIAQPGGARHVAR